ncbi:hypothetical protein ACF09Z_37865 [Streptomyces erythrochromogenes]|uniref:hypothetical protein n=1 Tax=Streptomyces erythrochromogenes TaxID=285574 RepID=UPI0036FD601A
MTLFSSGDIIATRPRVGTLLPETGVSSTRLSGVSEAALVPSQSGALDHLFPYQVPAPDARLRTGDAAQARERARIAALLLDDLLFAAPVFCIDAGNARVAAERTLKFLSEAAALVNCGHAASYVATLREFACAVDIDGSDDDWSVSALEHMTARVDELGGWWVTRRSGGGAGRWHLVAVLRTRFAREALRETVETVRTHWGATPRQIDWRRTLRPLSAPHRRTGEVDLPSSIEWAKNAFPSWASNLPVRHHRVLMRRETPATPWQRTFREVPPGEFWERLRSPGPDYYRDRSRSELLSTARLVVAGYDADAAWGVVSDTRHRGFARARRRGRHWWVKFCWNAAVEFVDSRRGTRTQQSPVDRWKRVTGPLLSGVRKFVWPGWTVATRHSRERVLAAVGDRMARQSLANCALPQRDLENDTGQSRNTIAAALSQLTKDGVLVKTKTYDQSQGTKSSNEYSVNLLVLDFTAESTEPPCSHTLAAPSRSWYSLATTLALHPGPHSTATFHTLSGYTPTPHPTRSQLANVETGLVVLQKLRVIRRRGRQFWELTGHAPRETAQARQRKERTAVRIEEDRRSFKAVWRATRNELNRRWHEQRERALARRAAKDQSRREVWWRSLSEDERTTRRLDWKARFAGMPPAFRAARVEVLVERRHLATRGAVA